MSYNLLGKFVALSGFDDTHGSTSGKALGRLGIWLHAGSVTLLVSGCLTEFPPLQPTDTTGDTTSDVSSSANASTKTPSDSSASSSGDGGTVDGSSSGTSGSGTSAQPDGGSSSSTDSMISCGEGETACGATCVRGNSCCATACEAPNAASECRDNECVISTCNADFFDCDGEYDNGCELAMPSMSAPEATVNNPLSIPRFDYEMGISVISQSAWAGVPSYKLNRRCSSCERNGQPEGVPLASERGVLPAESDFRGAFALAWNDVGLWANVVVIDDDWVTGDDVGETDARLYDNVMVVWDSMGGASDAGSGDDRILFAGIDGRLKDWRQTSATGAAMRVTGTGSCRSVHLQLTSQYLFMGSGGGAALDPGERYGFNIGYNDFDAVQGQTSNAERQHFVFGLEMTFASGDYYTGTRTLPQIELVSAP